MRTLIYAISIFCMSSTLALACSTHSTFYFENKNAKVKSSHICPKGELPFHSHQHPRVIVSDRDGELDVVYESGRTDKIILKKGIPVYLDTKQGLEPHKDINPGTHLLNITVVELMSAQ
ncbi:hypothetical protein Xsto_02044 [Xenorhabdus stockiae]|uniref:Lipoprotein n=1 Tax=Xenorhabdus stockiae TaxID=351614 RepID=A0A2D0KPW4_9GAMM|nr:hypothetical protein [Xenorhabdus stockiae]PHM65466.1 hypothetical protein Xsto_02044 [Xenorhabdus stockiae]